MADWYASSAAYAAVAAFVPSGVYTLGQFVKPTAPALKAQWVFRCTTAGTASTEPAWPTTNNATITTGGATFTNVTGQSTYGWSAAAGDVCTLVVGGVIRFVAGDRMFVSSDHSETQTTGTWFGSGPSGGASFTGGQILSVNRAGSVPPVAADLLPGASIMESGSSVMAIDASFPIYHYGINYIYTGTSAQGLAFNQNNGGRIAYFDNCQLYLNTATAGVRISNTNPTRVILNNTTMRFGATSQVVSLGGANPFEIIWQNTPSAIGGATIPTTLFNSSTVSLSPLLITARGVDLSAITGTLVLTSSGHSKYLFDSCRIAPGVTRYSVAGVVNANDEVELVNCYDGTNFISERHVPAGDVTTEFTITLSGGATDNVGTFSHKMVTNANVDKYANTLNGFWLDANYATTGSAKTATVEIISSASLNNDEISLLLEYEGTASSSVASITTSLPATVLTAASAVTTSTATWNSSPATPVKQHLQVTFTPRTAGRVRAQVRLGKPSATVYYDPRVTIT